MEKKELTIEDVSVGDIVKRINGSWSNSYVGSIDTITKIIYGAIHLSSDKDPNVSHSVRNFIIIKKNNNYDIY